MQFSFVLQCLNHYVLVRLDYLPTEIRGSRSSSVPPPLRHLVKKFLSPNVAAS